MADPLTMALAVLLFSTLAALTSLPACAESAAGGFNCGFAP